MPLAALLAGASLLGCGGGDDALPGAWSRTAVLSSQPGGSQVFESVAPGLPGASVPAQEATAAAACQNYMVDFDTAAWARPFSCNGNIGTYFNVPGNDTFVFSPGGYAGCGSCAIGTRVTLRYVFQVMTSTGSSFHFSVLTTYTRTS